jgi:hypothetical protein
MSNIEQRVNINKLSLISDSGELDITNIFLSFNIYEDLFSYFKTGKIVIQDTNDLISTLPIYGNEIIEIYFESNNNTVDRKKLIQRFSVYKLEQDLSSTARDRSAKVFVLYLISEEAITNEKCALSKRMNRDSIDVMSCILTDCLLSSKEFIYEVPENKLDFISNFWKPTRIFKYYEDKSYNNFHDYIFFENRDGFNFKSISQMMSNNTTHEITFLDVQDSMYNYNISKIYQMDKYFNIMEMLQNHYFGNTFYKLSDTNYGYKKVINDFISASEYSNILGKYLKHQPELANDSDINVTYKNAEQLSIRKILLNALSEYFITLKLVGDSTKTIGQVYDLNMILDIKHTQESNPVLNGKWLCTNINHEVLRNGEYTQNVRLVKNGFYNYGKQKGLGGLYP